MRNNSICKKFRCHLLSDVVLSENNATTGNKKGLDFIPGSNFLGIVASQLYDDLTPHDAYTIFHSGRVKFGDAHPSIGDMRGLRVPAVLFYEKGSSVEKGNLYLHHHIKDFESLKHLQLKQARSGFYSYKDKEATNVDITQDFSIKSAYDSKLRRSKDKTMFGYTALVKGLELCFIIDFDANVENKLVDQICQSLIGVKYVGRSRSAEYGKIEINIDEEVEEITSQEPDTNGFVTIYADGRLIFLDQESGLPTLQPSAEQLGFPGAKVEWGKSQIRTFQYAPWNFKRQAFDSDRCGIEKGSVLVLSGIKEVPCLPRYIGSYNNEGFGKVIFNPYFLDSNGDNGENQIIYKKSSNTEKAQKVLLDKPNTLLIHFLEHKALEATKINVVYKRVNDFVSDSKRRKLFNDASFSSQWGSIRNLAQIYSGNNLRKMVEMFLTHGVAESKWVKKGRRDALFEFMSIIDDERLQETLLNLSAEMAKICNKK